MAPNERGTFLLISFAFAPMNVVGSLRSYRWCRYLPPRGWTPRVITAFPLEGVTKDNSLLKQVPTSVRISRTPFLDPIEIYQRIRKWVTLSENMALSENASSTSCKPTGSGVSEPRKLSKRLKSVIIGSLTTPDHLVSWILFAVIEGIRVLSKEKKIEFILTTSPPHSSQLAGTILSKIFRKPHIVDLRDPWNDIYWGDYGAFRSRLELAMERIVISHASKVISSTESYTKLLQKRFSNLQAGKFETITNCFESEKFENVESKPTGKFTMCYLGIFYPFYEPYTYFEALSKWLCDSPAARGEVEMVIVGDGDPTTRTVIRKWGLEDVVSITGRLSHEEAIKVAKSSDLLLLLLGTDKKAPPGCVPSKLFEYLACGRRILAHVPEGEAASIIRKTGSGYVITTNNVDQMIEVIAKEYEAKNENQSAERSDVDMHKSEIFKYNSEYSIQKMIGIFEDVRRENLIDNRL